MINCKLVINTLSRCNGYTHSFYFTRQVGRRNTMLHEWFNKLKLEGKAYYFSNSFVFNSNWSK